jgi:hypothetical protein
VIEIRQFKKVCPCSFAATVRYKFRVCKKPGPGPIAKQKFIQGKKETLTDQFIRKTLHVYTVEYHKMAIFSECPKIIIHSVRLIRFRIDQNFL